MPDLAYVLNDPTTPQLNIPFDLPPMPKNMDFKVDGYRGATPTMYTLEHQAACCYVTVINGINMANTYASQPLGRWAAVNTLYVQPRAGKQLNAFYDRQALRFFYAMNPVKKTMIYAVNSHDVVAHELGHAILDSIRPDLFNMQAMEVWAFHESFGDINALLMSLQFDFIIDYLLQETGGDIRQSNTISRLAEEMGGAVYDMTAGRMGYNAGFLRNAVNSFHYTPPETLPRNCPDNQLCAEPHNFSRVFTGAWYDILCGIYEDQKTKTSSLREALITARDILGRYTFQALPIAPATIRFYDAVARAILVIDKANNYLYNQLINDIFIARGILSTTVRPLMSTNWAMFQTMLDPRDEVLNKSSVIAVRNKNFTLLPLPDYLLNVEAPGDTYYEFNGTGDCVDVITVSGEELVAHTHECVDFLKACDLIRPDKMTPFEIDINGNLIRSHFACCQGFNNAERPGEPECGRPWKRANNAGCSCNCANCSESGCGKKVKPCCNCPGPLPDSPNYVPGEVCLPYNAGIWSPAPLGVPPLPVQNCHVSMKKTDCCNNSDKKIIISTLKR